MTATMHVSTGTVIYVEATWRNRCERGLGDGEKNKIIISKYAFSALGAISRGDTY